MFALWCLVKSPLMLGTDLRELSEDSEAYRSEVTPHHTCDPHCLHLHTCCRILTNERLIAVNQDPLGVQGQCVKDCCSHGSIGGGAHAQWRCGNIT